MGLILLFLACDPPPAPAVDLRFYNRASLDLRGVRPTIDEEEALIAHPESLSDRIDAFTHDTRFGSQVQRRMAPIWQTRSDVSDVSLSDLGMANESGFIAAVGEEPIRIVGYIADHDLPWTDVVTADWTMANEILAERFPVDYPAGETGWEKVHYVDGRPRAGILSSAGMWWRYSTTVSNANRGRVNALSRILLCKDYQLQPVPFDPNLDLTDESLVKDALTNNPACVACHSTIDPIGAYLWGFYSEFSDDATDWAWYHPDREQHWKDLGVAPAYYGVPGHTVEDLGEQMAGDPRMLTCLTQRVFETLLQRAATLDDTEALTRHREALIDGGLTIRAVTSSVMADPAYRSLDGDDAPWKLMDPDLYATAVEDLTGYRYSEAGHDAMIEDWQGIRSVAGGGRTSATTALAPSPTMLEVQERIAQGAAAYVVAHDANDPANAMLLTSIPLTGAGATEQGALREQAQALILRILGQSVAVDGDDVASVVELWGTVYAENHDVNAAWAAVISGLLRDPDFVIY